jgi:hypothetical protein
MADETVDGSAGRALDGRAEALLGQMIFAIGYGADGVHINRAAIAKMRQRYEGPTYIFVQKSSYDAVWERHSIYTLRYFATIGRLAAQFATEDGSPYIDADQFERARLTVEQTYRRQIKDGAKNSVILGDICPDPPVMPDSAATKKTEP